jgi:hypothetical protein
VDSAPAGLAVVTAADGSVVAIGFHHLGGFSREPFSWRGHNLADPQRAYRRTRRTRAPPYRNGISYFLGGKNMSENRRQILQMLSERKITADEAERLIAAADGPSVGGATDPSSASAGKNRAKYLRVMVDSEESDGHDRPTKVNVRVPMQLLRAGVKLAYLIPTATLQRANLAMHEKGLPVDLTQIKPENLEQLIEQLNDLTVDVDQNEAHAKVKVRVFCE